MSDKVSRGDFHEMSVLGAVKFDLIFLPCGQYSPTRSATTNSHLLVSDRRLLRRSGELQLEVNKVSKDALATVGCGFDGVGGGTHRMWTHEKNALGCLVLRRFFVVVSVSFSLLAGPFRWLPPICAVRFPHALSRICFVLVLFFQMKYDD